jgi:hypothetical protein
MSNERAAFKAWLDAYGKAWGRNAEAAAALYTKTGRTK